jgi:integrase
MTESFLISEADQQRWREVEGELRTRSRVPGGGELLRPISRDNAWTNYRTALRVLNNAGAYDPDEEADKRWTQDRIDLLLNAKKPDGRSYAPLTISSWVVGTWIVVRAIAPNADVCALIEAEKRLCRIRVREKFIVDPAKLRIRASAIMQSSLDIIRAYADRLPSSVIAKPLLRALLEYQTALQISVLSLVALRLRNLTATELGEERNLFVLSTEWWLVFSRDVMKGKRAYDRLFPAEAVPWLETHLQEVRPVLARSYTGDHVWLSLRGGPQSDQAIRKAIKKMTEGMFGRPITPHWFRDCVATAMAQADPADLEAASWTLANHPDTVNIVYNHAGCAPARAAVVTSFASFAGWNTVDRRPASSTDNRTEDGDTSS